MSVAAARGDASNGLRKKDRLRADFLCHVIRFGDKHNDSCSSSVSIEAKQHGVRFCNAKLGYTHSGKSLIALPVNIVHLSVRMGNSVQGGDAQRPEDTNSGCAQAEALVGYWKGRDAL
jgi:hypothetical protein